MPPPAELSHGRSLRENVAVNCQELLHMRSTVAQRKLELKERREDMETRTAHRRPLSILHSGQEVYYQTGHRQWKLATVVTRISFPSTYVIRDKFGVQFTRNRIHLRPASKALDIPTATPARSTQEDKPLRKSSRLPVPKKQFEGFEYY